jgi:hypothetical protein
VPRLVCLSLAWGEDADEIVGVHAAELWLRPRGADRIVEEWRGDRVSNRVLLTGGRAIATYRALLNKALAGRLDLVAHNAAFDLTGMAEAAATHPESSGPLLVQTLEALEAGAVRCTLVREKLIAIGLDRLRGAPNGYFSLAGHEAWSLVARYLGEDRTADKGKHEVCDACGGSGVAIDDPNRNGRVWTPPHGGGMAGCPTCSATGSVGPWRMRYCQLDGVPLDRWPADAVRYAVADAVDALRVCDAQDHTPSTEIGPLVDEAGHIVDEIPQVRTAFAFATLAAWGVCVDPERTASLDAVVSKIVAEAAEIGRRAGFVRDANGIAHADTSGPDGGPKRGRPGSECKAAKHALVVAAYGGEETAPRNNPTDNEQAAALEEGREPLGSIKADRDTLLSSGHDDLIAYAEVGASLTLARTYVPILREGVALGPVAGSGEGGSEGGRQVHGPITSRPNILVASGRASWGQPNWTNPPREGGFRDCVVPRPGHVFVAADLGGAELVAWAQICLWEGFGSTMADAILAGRDLHTDFAADVIGIPYDEAMARRSAGDEHVKGQRQIAKVGNYGFLGGMGGKRFVVHARNQNTPLHEDREEALAIAWTMHAAFRVKWPESLAYFAWVSARSGTRDDPVRFTARQYVSGRLRGGLGYTTGCNTYFQGLVADGAKAATWRAVLATHGLGDGAAGRPARALAGCRIVLFLHDELIMEVPCGDGSPRYPLDAGHLTAAAAALSWVMIDAMAPYLPDLPIEADAAAMLRWHKGPERVEGPGGVLLPCDWPEGGVLR